MTDKMTEAKIKHAEVLAEIESQIEKLQAYVTAAKADNVNWSSVADAGYVRQQLNTALCFVGLSQDSAY